ncbi:MAG: hypothetical protein ACXWM1_13575, partial [Candidatus Binataceae bacterium]
MDARDKRGHDALERDELWLDRHPGEVERSLSFCRRKSQKLGARHGRSPFTLNSSATGHREAVLNPEESGCYRNFAYVTAVAAALALPAD